jgi:hypothetical protein
VTLATFSITVRFRPPERPYRAVPGRGCEVAEVVSGVFLPYLPEPDGGAEAVAGREE